MPATLLSQPVSIADLFDALGVDPETASALEKRNAQRALNSAMGVVRRTLGYDPRLAVRTEYYPPEASTDSWNSESAENVGIWESNGVTAVLTPRYRSGRTDDMLCLRHIPVRSISEVREDPSANANFKTGDFADATVLTNGTDFFLDVNVDGISESGFLRRANSIWSLWPRSIKITYQAGYTNEEFAGEGDIDASPIAEAVLICGIILFKQKAVNAKGNGGFLPGPIQSEKLGDYSYTIGKNAGGGLLGDFSSTDMPPDQVLELLQDFEQVCLHTTA